MTDKPTRRINALDNPARMPHPYEDWVRFYLPDDLPEALLQHGFDIFYLPEEALGRDPDDRWGEVACSVTDKRDVQWLYAASVARRIVDAMLARDEEAEMARWRYVPARDGRPCRENRDYAYNAVYTPLKFRYEHFLRLMARVPVGHGVAPFPIRSWLDELNAGCPADRPHWAYDEATRTFVELPETTPCDNPQGDLP